MSTNLRLFPSRVPFGRAQLPDGSELLVNMTAEYERAMRDLFERVGGDIAPVLGELTPAYALQDVASTPGSVLADIAALRREITLGVPNAAMLAEIMKRLDAVERNAAASVPLGEILKRLDAIERNAMAMPNWAEAVKRLGFLEIDALGGQRPTDWEHPGKIGAKTPNDGTFAILRGNSLAKVIADSPTSQVIATATATTVTNWTERFDAGGDFDPVTGIFTARRAGMYLVVARMSFSNVAFSAINQIAAVVILKNGVNSGTGHLIAQAAVSISAPTDSAVVPFNLAAGDTIAVRVFQNSGANASTQANTDSYFSILEMP